MYSLQVRQRDGSESELNVPQNEGSVAHEQSSALLPEAVANSESHPCFWMRAFIPVAWTTVTPPSSVESWEGNGLLGNGLVGPACLGVGSPESPLVVFGDASGGSDTHDNRKVRQWMSR